MKLGIPATFVALCLTAHWAVAQPSASNQARSWAAGCANCHGTQGNALEGQVSLAGMPKSDMVQKMQDFKTGRRPATLMHQLAKGYTDEQIEAIAAYYAAQKK